MPHPAPSPANRHLPHDLAGSSHTPGGEEPAPDNGAPRPGKLPFDPDELDNDFKFDFDEDFDDDEDDLFNDDDEITLGENIEITEEFRAWVSALPNPTPAATVDALRQLGYVGQDVAAKAMASRRHPRRRTGSARSRRS